MTALWLALAVLQAQGPVDEGTLLVRQDTVEIAREAFRLTPARATPGGWTLATTVRYDRSRPVIVLDPIVELGPDSVGTTLEYTVADPREPMRILGQFTRGRFVVRTLSRSSPRAPRVTLSRVETCGVRAAYEVSSQRPVQGSP